MDETIEQTILRILSQVSEIEKSKNKVLMKKTERVLKALAYMKAVVGTRKSEV
ncbi:MAG: hypothetical protein AB7O96_03570 [Pseudobdellovibrionaceae bacterium]